MTDREELETLIAKAKNAGAQVAVQRDGQSHPYLITVRDLKGVGPCPMSPIYFAEKMREVLR